MSALYPSYKADLLEGTIDLLTADVRLQLLDDTYTFDPTDTVLLDVPSGARRGAPVLLAGKTITVPEQGVFDANDATIPSVPTGTDVVAYVLYEDVGGTDSSRRLILYADGFFVQPNGGPIVIQHDDSAVRIFRLPA